MTYEYRCPACDKDFDVIKPAAEMERPESCPQCDTQSVRMFVPRSVHFTGTGVQHAEYNPGLGCVVRDKKHRAELCKQRGLVEMGNDFKNIDKMHDDDAQAREERARRRLEESA